MARSHVPRKRVVCHEPQRGDGPCAGHARSLPEECICCVSCHTSRSARRAPAPKAVAFGETEGLAHAGLVWYQGRADHKVPKEAPHLFVTGEVEASVAGPCRWSLVQLDWPRLGAYPLSARCDSGHWLRGRQREPMHSLPRPSSGRRCWASPPQLPAGRRGPRHGASSGPSLVSLQHSALRGEHQQGRAPPQSRGGWWCTQGHLALSRGGRLGVLWATSPGHALAQHLFCCC